MSLLLFYPSRFRELETEGKFLKSNFPCSFGPETLAKTLGMGIPSEINDESRPRGRGKRESCRKFFSTHFCVCSTPRHPSCSLFGARGVLGGRKPGAALAAFLARALWVLSAASPAAPPVCASTCWTASWRPKSARADAARGCPSRRRRPSPAPAVARGRAAQPPPLASRALRPGSAHGPLLPTAGWGKVDKGRGQAGA